MRLVCTSKLKSGSGEFKIGLMVGWYQNMAKTCNHHQRAADITCVSSLFVILNSFGPHPSHVWCGMIWATSSHRNTAGQPKVARTGLVLFGPYSPFTTWVTSGSHPGDTFPRATHVRQIRATSVSIYLFRPT